LKLCAADEYLLLIANGNIRQPASVNHGDIGFALA
jgi:hypothetical protein